MRVRLYTNFLEKTFTCFIRVKFLFTKMWFFYIWIFNETDSLFSAIIFQTGICNCQRLLNVFLIFSYDFRLKATVLLGGKSETCFTIFIVLFNRFTLLVMSFVPTCINILPGWFFSRSSRFSIIFSLVPPEKPATEILCFSLKLFPDIAVSIESPATRMFLFCCCCPWESLFVFPTDFRGFVSSSVMTFWFSFL